MFALAIVPFIGIFVFLIMAVFKKRHALRNAGLSAAAWLLLIALAPDDESTAQTSKASQDVVASNARTTDEPTSVVEEVETQSDPVDTNSDGVVDAQPSPGEWADYDGDGVLDPPTDAPTEEQATASAAAPEDSTSPEADPTLKSLNSNIVPVRFNNVRNVGGDTGDNLGAGLWMSAEAAGYKCQETEAYSSPLLNSLKSDLKTDLENNAYTYEEIENLSDESGGELIVWKATSGEQIAIGFFATTGSDAGTMAICRATLL